MNYFPVFLNLKKKKCVVIGGGKIAEMKIRQLLKAAAEITVISPDVTIGLKKLISARKIKHKKRQYRNSDTKNSFLAIAATSNEAVNKKISIHTRGLVNAVDMPASCSFIMPSVLRKGHLTIAVSSSGISPSISKTLSKEFGKHIPDDLPEYLSYLKTIRLRIFKSMPGSSKKIVRKRSLILKKLGSSKILGFLRQKGFKYVKFYIDDIIKKTVPHNINYETEN